MERRVLNGASRGVGPIATVGPLGSNVAHMASLLEPVGLGQTDNDIYLDLLTAPRSTPADVATRLELPIGRVRRSLQRLLDAGLAARLAGARHCYVAAPPEVAVDALVLRRQQQLEQLRSHVRELATQLKKQTLPSEPSELIELVEGAEAIGHHLARMQLGAVEEVMIIDAPPYVYGQPVQNAEELQALSRGVKYRAIYHAPGLADQRHLDQMMVCVHAGEQARALPTVHMKMIIADRRLALLPLSFSAAETRTRILVHASPLLDALVLCFESLWNRATPIAGSTPHRNGSTDAISDTDRQLLSMLAGGIKDRAIARALGVTERTVSRRIQDLMAQLEASTRFQAGLQAGRRGWL